MQCDAERCFMKTIRTTVSIPEEQYRQLQALSDQHKLSIAWIVRLAINDLLSRKESFEPMREQFLKISE
jgi:predicted DNA-binding protein